MLELGRAFDSDNNVRYTNRLQSIWEMLELGEVFDSDKKVTPIG